MRLEPIIGLEIHVQLKTKSKMFCPCPAHSDEHVAPNVNVCPVCLAHPGTLPVPNGAAIQAGVRLGLALNCRVLAHSKFDRKNYFYPDLPKGYQISQFDLPVCAEGYFDLVAPKWRRPEIRVSIVRAHLEEDAAKNFHEGERSYVDFNRAGTPLVEVVTGPDFRAPEEAKAFLQELRTLVRALGVSEGDMEKGQMRCDANVSLRPVNEDGTPVDGRLYPKTEVKNINSFRAVERALQFEIQRQTALWITNTPPDVTTTRGWDDVKQVTVPQRTKEEAADYRYFPEPDVPPLELTELAEEWRRTLPELPAAKRTRFMDEYGFSYDDAKILVEEPERANFIEDVMSELVAWIAAQPEFSPEDALGEKKKLAKMAASWFINKLGGLLSERATDVRVMKIDAENFAEFITLLATGKLSSKNGMVVLAEMLTSGADPSHVMEDKRLGRIEDIGVIAETVDRVLEHHPDEVKRYLAGKKELLQFFVGVVMKETDGNADAAMTRNVLLQKLEK